MDSLKNKYIMLACMAMCVATARGDSAGQPEPEALTYAAYDISSSVAGQSIPARSNQSAEGVREYLASHLPPDPEQVEDDAGTQIKVLDNTLHVLTTEQQQAKIGEMLTTSRDQSGMVVEVEIRTFLLGPELADQNSSMMEQIQLKQGQAQIDDSTAAALLHAVREDAASAESRFPLILGDTGREKCVIEVPQPIPPIDYHHRVTPAKDRSQVVMHIRASLPPLQGRDGETSEPPVSRLSRLAKVDNNRTLVIDGGQIEQRTRFDHPPEEFVSGDPFAAPAWSAPRRATEPGTERRWLILVKPTVLTQQEFTKRYHPWLNRHDATDLYNQNKSTDTPDSAEVSEP